VPGPVITTDGLLDNPQPAALPPIAGWCIASGSGDVIQASYVPPLLSLQDGVAVAIRASASNATTTPSFSPDGLSQKTIRKAAGALAAGDLVLNGEYVLRYNLTLDQWTIL